MVGYSEVIQTMAAMVLFSLILMTSNKIILLNSHQEVESEAENQAIAIAQSYIEKARVLPFDNETVDGIPLYIPEGFSDCGPGGATNEENFDDFDDYDGYSDDIDWVEGSGDNAFHVEIDVNYVNPPDYDMASGYNGTPYTKYKKMVVTVTSDFLKDGDGNLIEIKIPYLRRYYRQ